ncbi:MAG: ABC transporter substrate-binding protein [Alphaproteobacteria bacterium]|nr:ABC transporter substrate-binding protein [Alphaproteobacteria bacterium]
MSFVRSAAALAGLVALTLPAATLPAQAEVKELRIAKQYGLGYLQMMLMEDMKLVEEQARKAGIGDLKVSWATFRSSDVMNDALISGTIDFVCLGVPGIATIWAKTKGNMDVKAASGLNAIPLFLNTRDPRIKSIRDLTDKDRVAMPAVKVSMQAIFLQMAAAKEFGEANFTKLDSLTVSMAHPDGMAAFLSGAGEINNHFTSAPFQYKELARPGVRRLLSSTEILGSKISFNLISTTSKFQRENPKVYGVFLAALEDATQRINKDKRWAAEQYLRIANDRSPIEEMMVMMNDPEIEFTTRPFGASKMIDFMHRTGSIKVKPDSWKDMSFPNLHQYEG